VLAHRHGTRHNRCAIFFTLCLAIFSAACQPAPEATRRSLWGEILVFARAEQSKAPALWADTERVVAAWVGSDASGVHHDARQWSDGSLSPVSVLPLPPLHPFAQSWAAAPNGALHLLWLDASGEGENQLFSALITQQLTVERGPTPISDELALRYASAEDNSGRVWAAWSGGLLSEPALSLRSIDAAGRPQPVQVISANGADPAIVSLNDGTLLLFWLQHGQLMSATVSSGIVSQAAALTPTVYLAEGDRLHNLAAGADQTHAYVFWNITRARSEDETWIARGELGASSWSQPQRLQYDLLADEMFETGFNTGTASAATTGETPLAWAAPLAGQHAVLPVAVQSPMALALVYFSGGQIVGYQEIVPTVELAGSPALAADRNRHLYLAWAQPSTQGAADLLLTSTLRGSE
jgi:hypothetical protein